VQHALRAFTPRDQKAVKSAAETMRPNPAFKIEQSITELGVGEALVSLLDEKGRPGITERALIVPPCSRLGPIDEAVRAQLITSSTIAGVYEKTIDRESAYEILKARVTETEQKPQRAPSRERAQREEPKREEGSLASDILFGRRGPHGGRQTQGLIEAMAKSAARSVGSQA